MPVLLHRRSGLSDHTELGERRGDGCENGMLSCERISVAGWSTQRNIEILRKLEGNYSKYIRSEGIGESSRWARFFTAWWNNGLMLSFRIEMGLGLAGGNRKVLHKDWWIDIEYDNLMILWFKQI